MIYEEPEKPKRSKFDLILDAVLLFLAIATSVACVKLIGLF